MRSDLGWGMIKGPFAPGAAPGAAGDGDGSWAAQAMAAAAMAEVMRVMKG